jgi:hypothetical protein
MSFKRKTVGEVEQYKGHRVSALFCGPDLLCSVDGMEIGSFYLTVEGAKRAGRSYVDQVEQEQAAAKVKQRKKL